MVIFNSYVKLPEGICRCKIPHETFLASDGIFLLWSLEQFRNPIRRSRPIWTGWLMGISPYIGPAPPRFLKVLSSNPRSIMPHQCSTVVPYRLVFKLVPHRTRTLRPEPGCICLRRPDFYDTV